MEKTRSSVLGSREQLMNGHWVLDKIITEISYKLTAVLSVFHLPTKRLEETQGSWYVPDMPDLAPHISINQ